MYRETLENFEKIATELSPEELNKVAEEIMKEAGIGAAARVVAEGIKELATKGYGKAVDLTRKAGVAMAEKGMNMANKAESTALAPKGIFANTKNSANGFKAKIGDAMFNAGAKINANPEKALRNAAITGGVVGGVGTGIGVGKAIQNKKDEYKIANEETFGMYKQALAELEVLAQVCTPEELEETSQEILAALVGEDMEKVAKEKDPNRTKFWKDRAGSAFKDAVIGGIPGALIGAGVGAAIGGKGDSVEAMMRQIKRVNTASAIGAVGGTSAISNARLKKMHNKEFGTNPDAKDYAKATAAKVLAVPTAGWSSLVATPEAIIKKKLRDKEKTASELLDDIVSEKLASMEE